MKFEISIEKASEEDASIILDIQKKAFYTEALIHNNFTIPPLTQSLKSIRSDFKEFTFYCVRVKSQIIATAKVKLLRNKILQINRLVVHPDFQNSGIGRSLMINIESSHPNAEAYDLFTAEKSLRNIYFYKSLGYKIIKHFTEVKHPDISMVHMRKSPSK